MLDEGASHAALLHPVRLNGIQIDGLAHKVEAFLWILEILLAARLRKTIISLLALRLEIPVSVECSDEAIRV